MSNQSYPMYDTSFASKLEDFKARVDAIPAKLNNLVSYKKKGGLHFIKLGRISGSFSVKRAKPSLKRDNEKLEPATVAVISQERLRFVK